MADNRKTFKIKSDQVGDVVSQLAAFYHVKVEFGKAESQHIRIFFNWDKTKTLKQNLEILNAFERSYRNRVAGDYQGMRIPFFYNKRNRFRRAFCNFFNRFFAIRKMLCISEVNTAGGRLLLL